MKIFNYSITGERWPWQNGYNWKGMEYSSAPLNQPRKGETAAPRFGAGWKFKIGAQWSSSNYILIELLYGIVKIERMKKCPSCGKCIDRKEQGMGLQQVMVPGQGYVYARDMHRKCFDLALRGDV